jgi:hypothetical protein
MYIFVGVIEHANEGLRIWEDLQFVLTYLDMRNDLDNSLSSL